MCHNWITQNIVEHARERQSMLYKEAAHQRLLQQIAADPKRFVFFRKGVLFTGNLLIASGTWLKQRAALEQKRVHVPTMQDHFSQVR